MAIRHHDYVQFKEESNMPNVNVGVIWQPLDNAVNVSVMKGSPLGNPYAFKNMSDEERDKACESFEVYFKHHCNRKNHPINTEMHRLLALMLEGKNINLQCCCSAKGKRCHASTIKNSLIKAYSTIKSLD